jgi:hypothetical protein
MAGPPRGDPGNGSELVNEQKRIPAALVVLAVLALVAYFLRGMFV